MYMVNSQKSKRFTTTNLLEAIVSQNSTCTTPKKIDYEQWAPTLKRHQSKLIGINSSILKYLDEKYERLQQVSAYYKKLFYDALETKKKYRYMIETIKKKHRQKSIYYRQEIQRLTKHDKDGKEFQKDTCQGNALSFVPVKAISSHTYESSSFPVASGKSKDKRHTTTNKLLFCNKDSLQTLYGVSSKKISRCKTITHWTIPPLYHRTHLLCLFSLLPKKNQTLQYVDHNKKQTKAYAIPELDCITNVASQFPFAETQKIEYKKSLTTLLFTSDYLQINKAKPNVLFKETITCKNNKICTARVHSHKEYHNNVFPTKLCNQHFTQPIETSPKLTNVMLKSFDSSLLLEDLSVSTSRLYNYQKFFSLSKSTQM